MFFKNNFKDTNTETQSILLKKLPKNNWKTVITKTEMPFFFLQKNSTRMDHLEDIVQAAGITSFKTVINTTTWIKANSNPK